MNMTELKQIAYEANMALWRHGLVTLTWGNVSALDDSREIMVIKPSGVSYEAMCPQDMVPVRLDNGLPLYAGGLRPSSDTPTHVALYRAWPDVFGAAHTHSRCAVAFSQACTPIVCLGTTHADTFHGDIPCARPLTAEETARDYEGETGALIVRTLDGVPPLEMPAILLGHHGPFTWGSTPMRAVEHAVILEEVAAMALATFSVRADAPRCPRHIIEKHYERKHGAHAYYGQGGTK